MTVVIVQRRQQFYNIVSSHSIQPNQPSYNFCIQNITCPSSYENTLKSQTLTKSVCCLMNFGENNTYNGLTKQLKSSQPYPRQYLDRLKNLQQSQNQETYSQKDLFSQGRHVLENRPKSNQVKLEDSQLVPRPCKTSPRDNFVTEAPLAPLRFSQIQKSIQILRRAIPEIVDDAMVDRMYVALFKNFNNLLSEGAGRAKQKIEMQMHFSKNRDYTHHQIARKKVKNVNLEKQSGQQKMYEQKMWLFKKQEEKRAIEQQRLNFKKVQNNHQKGSGKKLLTQVWNEGIQAEFIQLYRIHPRFKQIKKQLGCKYPQLKEYFTYSQLRYQSYKIFRLAIRKLYFLITQFKEAKLPDLLRVTEIRYNFILFYKQGIHIRVMLIELYCLERFDRELIVKLIISINNLCIELEQDKELVLGKGHRRGIKGPKPEQNISKLQFEEEGPEKQQLLQYEHAYYKQQDQLGYINRE